MELKSYWPVDHSIVSLDRICNTLRRFASHKRRCTGPRKSSFKAKHYGQLVVFLLHGTEGTFANQGMC